MTLSRPRTTGRMLRGSALGLGLLVAGGVTAPSALAIEDPTGDTTTERPEAESASPEPLQEVPSTDDAVPGKPMAGDFGTGKRFSVDVQPTGGAVPEDLDLSGAVFRATPVVDEQDASPAVVELRDDEADSYECTTDDEGTCTFDGIEPGSLLRFLIGGAPGVWVPVGTYSLTQVAASPGLAVNEGSGTFTICAYECDTDATTVVDGDSLFRTSLVTRVTDADTGAPIACAAYELTGPDYPHDGSADPAAPAAEVVPAECVVTAAPTSTPTTTGPAPADDTGSPSQSSSSSSSSSTGSTDSTEGEQDGDGTGDATDDAAGDGPVVDVDTFVRDDEPISFGTRTSDSTGTLIFSGWFLPAEGYLLTPTATPAGYARDATDAFGITTTVAQAAAGEPAAVSRTLVGALSPGSPAPSGGVAGAGTTAAAGTPSAGAATTSGAASTSAGTTEAALATTGSPVGTMLLVGTGLVAVGGGALVTSTVSRRRARQLV